MSESKVKVPIKNGLAKARQKLKEMRIKKSPSPDLVKIIDEVTHHTPKEKDSQNKIYFVATQHHNLKGVVPLLVPDL